MSQPPSAPNQNNQNNQVDLVELIQKMWIEKWLIIRITVAVTLTAAAYVFLTPSVYRAQTAVIPPSVGDIAGFNMARNILNSSNIVENSGPEGTASASYKEFTTKDVYSIFTRNLQSDQSKRQFYRDVYLPSLSEEEKKAPQDALYQDFLRQFYITAPATTQSDRFLISVEGGDPAQAADWVGRYIQDVGKRSLQEMLGNTQSEIQVQGHNLMQQIESIRYSAKVRREDRLMRLKEALKISQAIGLENPPMISGQMNNQLSAIMDGSLTYMRGAKALKAEIDALTQRASDDPFVPELRRLQEQHALYASLRVQPERVAVYRLDGTIEIPDEPIKPKKLLIVILAVLLGLILGSFVALIKVISPKLRSAAEAAV